MTPNHRAQQIIGRCIRVLREDRELTLEQLADAAGITYQYLSGVETGKRNFTISLLEAVAGAMRISLPVLVAQAYDTGLRKSHSATVDQQFFRHEVPLPPGLRVKDLAAAMNQTQSTFRCINRTLRVECGKKLADFIQGNNLSGLVSNILADSIAHNSPYKHNHHQRYPDLIHRDAVNGRDVGLEVKVTVKVGKGGESHNGHGGWHAVACYRMDDNGDIQFVHVMFAVLNGHQHESPDWKYIGSKVNRESGSRRTETYVTTPEGTTKLRDGSVYLNERYVDFRRWRQIRRNGESPPSWSIFAPSSMKE